MGLWSCMLVGVRSRIFISWELTKAAGPSPLWVASFPKKELLSYIRTRNLDEYKQEHEPASFVVFLQVNPWVPALPSVSDGLSPLNWNKHSPAQLLLVRVAFVTESERKLEYHVFRSKINECLTTNLQENRLVYNSILTGCEL